MIRKRSIDVLFIILFLSVMLVGTNKLEADLSVSGVIASAAGVSRQATVPLKPLIMRRVANDTCNDTVTKNLSNCFYGSVKHVVHSLEKAALIYVRLCALETKPRLSRLVDLAGKIGFTEGFTKANGNNLPANAKTAIASLSSYSEFKFIGHLKELQTSFQEDVARGKLVDRLWGAISDELDAIIRQGNYPFFLRKNVWHLMQNMRIVNMLRTHYGNSLSLCLPNTWPHVIHFYEIGSNPNFVTIFKPGKPTCTTNAHTVQVTPQHFTNGGIVFTFWGKSNLGSIVPNGKTQNVLTGYLDNRLVYEWTLIDDCQTASAQVIHEIKILNEVIQLRSESRCADHFFGVIAIQKACDKYAITISVRFLASNTRKSVTRNVFADNLENTQFKFNQAITSNHNLYKNIPYSVDKELLLMSYSTTPALLQKLQERTKCDNQNGKCLYSDLKSCVVCAAPLLNHKGTCVTQCPDGFFNNGQGYCRPCAPQCGTCTGAKNGNCKTCVLGLLNNNGLCVPTCPAHLAANKLGRCVPCGKKCVVCRDEKTCSKCAADHFLKDGTCVNKCGAGFFASYTPNVCNKCGPGCAECLNGNKCQVCDKGFYFRNGQCVRACGDGFWTNEATRTCVPCLNGCATCKNSKSCITCVKGLILSKKTQTCVNKCGNGLVMINGACAPCADKNCLRCSATNTKDCKVCNGQTFLKKGTCVPACGEGFYADSRRNCVPCVNGCKLCTKEKCLQCYSPKVVFKDTQCLTHCPDGYVRSGNVCVRCNEPTKCRKCVAKSLSTCTQCYKGEVLFAGKCVKTCPPRFFQSGNICKPCQKGCLTCVNANSCKVCDKDWFLKNNGCVDCCGVGYTEVKNTCQRCTVHNCDVCNPANLGRCEKCVEGTFLYNNVCHKVCPIGTYANKKNGVCEPCGQNCALCANNDKCLRCKIGFVLQDKKCQSFCNDGFVPVNGICTPCKNNRCRKCGPGLITCTECPLGSLLYKGDCLKTCPDGTFANKGRCVPCTQPCKECNNATSCTACPKGFFLFNGKCTDQCPDFQTMHNGKCVPCKDAGCQKCSTTDPTTCLVCCKEHVLHQGKCLNHCHKGFYEVKGVCHPCKVGCARCDGTKCLECNVHLFLLNGSCVKACPAGTVADNGRCIKCHVSCKSCAPKDPNTCTQCSQPYKLFNGQCLNACPVGTWATALGTCAPCQVNKCGKCAGGVTCTECLVGYVLQNNKCIPAPCSKGYVQLPGTRQCVPCQVQNCEKCPANNVKSCTICSAPHLLVNGNKCVSPNCPVGFFKIAATRTCAPCSTHCNQCQDATNCITCQNNYFLFQGRCRPDCPSGYVKSNGKCLPCDTKNCATCTPNGKTCLQCNKPLFLNDNQCVPECPAGRWSLLRKCVPCSPGCAECCDGTRCDTCKEPLKLTTDGKCVDSCPARTVLANGKCHKCLTGRKCLKCDVKNHKQCVQCIAGYFLKAGKCVQQCGPGFTQIGGNCQPCGPHCNTCTLPSTCQKCDVGYFMQGNKCVPNCPVGSYNVNGKCNPCSDRCASCNANKCLQCNKGAYLHNGVCVNVCPTGTYVSINTCKPCGPNCIDCKTASTCTICRDNFFLFNGQCIPNCKTGTVQVAGACAPCGTNCNVCNKLNIKECITCAPGTVLHQGQCVPKCPLGFFNNKGQCSPCIKGCDLCSNATTCQKCTPPLNLSNDQKACTKDCPDGYAPGVGKCAPCKVEKCKTCTGVDNGLCTGCTLPGALFDQKCIPTCPPKLWFRNKAGKCERCPAGCYTCSYDRCITCIDGFALVGKTCQNVCAANQIKVNGVCQNCSDKNCETCDKTKTKCLKCKSGFVLDKVNGVDTCVECCGEGWFDNKGRCDKCVPRCSQCFNKSECAVCEKGLVLQNGQCVVRCLPGYVQRDLKCHKCSDAKCLRCDPLTQNTCSLCDKGYSLKNGKCVPDCGSGFYRFAITATESVCRPCDQRCSKCDGPLNCQECNKGFVNRKGVCVPTCPAGWTLNSRNRCVQCWSKPCQKCDVNNAGICLVCQPGFYLKGNQCVKVCGPGYRVNGQTCVPCTDPACVQCNVAVTNCNKCQFPLVVLNGNCVKSCPIGMSSKNGVCTKCDEATCEKCHPERTDKCSVCKKGYLLTNRKKCVPKCPAGTYSFQGVKCLPCKGNCATCAGPFKCETCIKGFFLNSKKQCTDGCANGQAKLSGKCAPCVDKACAKCSGPANGLCLKCNNGFLYKGQCYPKCPEGTYQIAQTCRKCSPHCLACKNGQSCTKCNPITVLQGKHCVKECYDGYQNVKGVCTKCKNFGRVKRCPPPPKPPVCRPRFFLHNKNCVDHCPKGTMPDANRNCQPCGPNCIQCHKKNQCSRCTPTHVLHNGVCLPKCPSGYVNVIGVCQPCNQKACLTCRPQNRDHCTGCAAPLISHKGKCVPSCPAGTFRNGNKCSKCDPSCATCAKKGQCITCRPQFTLSKGKCIAKCQPGKVLVLNQCIACQDVNCQMCRSNNINKCITCNKGWTLHRGECIKTCPNGFYMTKEGRCAPCSKFCDRCNEKTCLQCHKGFVPFKRDPKNCVPCRDVLHVVEKGQCTRCKPAFCLKCVKGNSQKCQLCHISKVLVNGQCLNSCPNGLFRFGQTCKTCSPNCAVCRNANTCVKCKAPHFLFNGQCVSKCPAGFIFNGKNKCQRCAQRQCLECQKNLTTCIKCAPPSILFKGTCHHHCPNGTAMVKGTCTPCKAGCKLCTAAKCYVCAAGLKLRGNECVKDCGLGYLTKGNKCVPCLDSKCAKCNPVNKCSVCKSPNLLNPNGSCTLDCKNGFFKLVANNTCAPCEKGCEICSGIGKCSRCEKGLFLHEGKCVPKCPDRFSPTESRCAPCAVAHCKKCQRDVLKCTECDNNFFNFNGKCVPSCPAGTYKSKGNKCKKCDARCDLCTSYANCTKCKPEFHLNKGKCETITCPDGKVLINDKCVSCADPNCKACLTNVNQCVKCKSPFLLHDSGCVSSCPNGFFADKNGICQPCATGCEVCKSQNVCTKCTDGFNLWKDNCVKTCPLGYFGDCKEKVCKKCNDACEVCTDASSVNCKHCAKDFFLSGNTCVKGDNCRKGTYPDSTTRKCATCKIPFCSVCLDFDTCEKCINGFQVNKNGGCSEAKSFINIIPQNPKLLSQITYPLLRTSEVVNFNSHLKGTGIGSTTVSYTFFLRRITQYDVDTTVFQTTSKDPAHNVRFYIHNDNCYFSVNGDSHKVSNCSYNTIRNWNFYTIVLNRNGPNSSVHILSGRQGETPLLNFNSTLSPTIHWLSRSSNIEFNDKGRGNAYELANFNVFDYAPNRNDTTTFAKARPVTCDYACVDCREKCHRCAGDVAPVNGTCPAVYLPLATDLQIFTNKPAVSLRSKVSKRLDSKRYAFTTWFFSTRPKNNDYTIGQLHYPYQPSTPIIAVRVVNNKLQVQVNSQVWNTNAKVSPNKWYHVGVTVNKNGQVGYWLVPRNGKPFSGIQKLNTPVRLLTEDASFSVNGATAPNNFQGSFFDGRLYVNNIPQQPRVNEHYNGLRCPKNCLVCNQAMRCVRCTNGFQLNKDYQCVDNDLGARILGLDKYSFWKNDTYTIHVPNKFYEKPFSLSFWYRKKIHSVPEKVPQPFFTVLSYAPSNAPNTLYPLVQETITNNPKYTSNFTIGGDCGPQTKFVENFSNEVYTWIHFVLNFYPNKGLVTFNVKNDNKISFVGNYTYNATKFVFGDPKGRDMNFEIGHAFFYSKPISESNLPKVRQTEPRDCDASCKKCDYFTGKCQECKIRRPGINAVCPNLLLGYESAYTYNVQTFDRTRAKMFSTTLKNSFTRDVNSLEYSVIGYFRLFDLKITDQYQNNRFALFTVTNRRDGKKSPSNHLISLHIRTTKGRPHFIWVNNDHDKVVETEIQGLKVKPNQWIFVYATINVVKKRLDFAFRVENKESKTQVGAIQFKNFPEKLQERGSLILFGIGQRLPKDYKTLNAQFFYFYASPNLRWNPVMVDKYRKAFPVKPDPKCTANCLRCIHDYSRKVNVCLKCKTGFAVQGDKCVKNLHSDYIIFSDQLNNHFLPPKTDVNLPAQALPATKNTFAFYFQRNYMPRSQGGNRVILQAGQLTVSLHITQSTSATLTFSVKGVANTISFSDIDSHLDLDYGWHLVLINFDTNTLKVIIRNESGKTIGEKSISWNNVALRITSLSFNSLHKEVSIYGPHIMLHYHYNEPLFGYPHVNCGIDCNACVNDKCVDCQYGFDLHGRCKNKPLKPFGFKVQQGSKFENRFPISRDLGNFRFLRSHSWSIYFTFQSKGDLNNLVGRTLFRVQNSHTKEFNTNLINDHIFSVKFHKNRSFFISVNTRHYQNHNKSPQGWTTKSLKPSDNNKNYFVGIVIDSDTDKIHFYVYNSPTNFIKQSFSLEGVLDNIINKATLIFGEGFGNDKTGILVDNTRFYYEKILGFPLFEKLSRRYVFHYQEACSRSTRNQCKQCAHGFLVNNGEKANYCAPTKVGYSWYLNHVRQFDEIRSNYTVPSPVLVKDPLDSYTFSFWYRRTLFENDPHGVANIGGVVLIHYEANTLTFNVEEFNCTVVGTIRVPNVYAKTDGLDWLHITVSVNVKEKVFQVVIHNVKTGANRFVTAPINVKSLGTIQQQSITWSLNTNPNCTDLAWSFEVSSFVFLPNWFPKDTSLIAIYRIRRPINCESKCKTTCDANVLCPNDNRFVTQINVPSVSLPDVTKACEVPLFRNLTSYFGNFPLAAPSFNKYLVAFELNIPALQSSTYTVNKNILLSLNNDLPDCDLDYTHVIADNVVKYGVLTVEYRGNALRFYIGGSKANTYAAFYDFVFESNNFKGISRVNVEFYVNAEENYGKLIIYIDDLSASYEIKTTYPPQPITRDTVVFNHPAISNARINVHNARFNYDFYYNIFPKSWAPTYASNLCKSRAHCEKCSIIPKATSLHCHRCAKGYKLINNVCLDESSFAKKQ